MLILFSLTVADPLKIQWSYQLVFHKMILTVLKTTFKKGKPKKIVYRSRKNYDKSVVSTESSDKLTECQNYCLQVLNTRDPLKKRLVRVNEVPYMTKTARKAIANRSRLENQYYKYNSAESLRAYKKQKNVCSRLYKKEGIKVLH